MSRITDYILEPKVVYTEGGFLVRVKVQDDYKYKKYIVSENLHYKTVQGTSFTLTDADSTKQASITELKGNTSQEGTPTPSNPIEVETVSGDNNIVSQNKNILVASGDTSFMSGITVTKNNASNIIINGSGTGGVGSKAFAINGNGGANYTTYISRANVEVKTLKVGTYAFSVHNITGETTATEVNFDVIKMRSSTPHQQIARISYGQSTNAVFTVTEEGDYYFAVGFAYSNSAVSFTNFSFDVQLEKNTQATSFLAHEGTTYRVDLGGKNLFDKSAVTEGKRLDSRGQPYNDNNYALSDFMPIQPSTTYTYSRYASGGGSSAVAYYKSDKTFISRTMWNSGLDATYKTFTTPDNARYIRVTDLKTLKDQMQVEIGNISTSFSPYTANPIELCKIGNYQDKIYYSAGKWYIEKNVGKVVVTGATSEGWTKVNNCFQTGGEFPSDIKNIGSTLNALSSHFKYEYWASGITSNMTNNCFGWNTAKKLTMRYDTCSTANDFKTWLGNNNVTVYYQLATPTYTEITDTYLLTQLNGILDIDLYENLCYVDWVGIENPTMSLLYSGTEDLGIKYIITEDGKKIRTDWRKLGRR